MRYEFSEHAKKQLLKMDRPAQEQIKKYMDDISTLQDPRSRGKALKGNFADLWRYRSGDYRIICDIQYVLHLVETLIGRFFFWRRKI